MRKIFVFNPDKHFLGEPCKYGHKGYRFKSSPGVCCECNEYQNGNRREYYNMRQRRYSNTPEGMATRMFLSSRNRQKKRHPNEPFNLTKEWILGKILAGYCEVTGLPFSLAPTSTLKRPFAPSIDKKNPKEPYIIENCQIVCYIYNIAKGEFSHEDVCILAKSLVNGICK
jgi:hypothetical protein